MIFYHCVENDLCKFMGVDRFSIELLWYPNFTHLSDVFLINFSNFFIIKQVSQNLFLSQFFYSPYFWNIQTWLLSQKPQVIRAWKRRNSNHCDDVLGLNHCEYFIAWLLFFKHPKCAIWFMKNLSIWVRVLCDQGQSLSLFLNNHLKVVMNFGEPLLPSKIHL